MAVLNAGYPARRLASSLILSLVIAGCGGEPPALPGRAPLTSDELAVSVSDPRRLFMLSDKRGGFLVGDVERGRGLGELEWSVGGTVLLHGIAVVPAAGPTALYADSATVSPAEVVLFFKEGSLLRIFPLELTLPGTHALAIVLEHPGADGVELRLVPGPALGPATSGGSMTAVRWEVRGRKGRIVAYGGGKAQIHGGSIQLPGGGTERIIVACLPSTSEAALDSLYRQIDRLRQGRLRRINGLLERTFFRTSDSSLTRAINWLKLSLDAMLIEGRDTFAVAGLPWDGTVSGRASVQAISGLDIATGAYGKAGGLIRSLARYQGKDSTRPTFGWIPETIRDGTPAYTAADVGPWFVRELYDHITHANDTALARSLYPVIRKSLEGTYRFHADKENLLVHGDRETWMNGANGLETARRRSGPVSPRGTRAAEMQLLWYFQQIIGSYVATFVGDWKSGERWAAGAERTGEGFNRIFVDTTGRRIADHVTADGTPVYELRPNAMASLEIIRDERVQQQMLKQTISSLVYRHGVGTLAQGDPRFSPAGPPDGSAHDGPVWTWLTGPFQYALTRYDHQDSSFEMTSWLVTHLLERDMVGTLPEMFEASSGAGGRGPRVVGLRSSSHGMAEVIRSLYQDYLGIGVDAAARTITLQPKLPAHLTDADVTVYAGDQSLRIVYAITPDAGRVVVALEGGTSDMKLGVVWMMPDGSAWRGSTMVSPGQPLRLVFTDDDALAYREEEWVALTGKWKIRHFSKREEFTGFRYAVPPQP